MDASVSSAKAGSPAQAGRPGPRRRRWLPRWRWHNAVRLLRAAWNSLRPDPVPLTASQLHRLHQAERRGLQLAILCRTVLLDVALFWYVASLLLSGATPTVYGVTIPLALTLLGILHFIVLGTRFDQPYVKFAAVFVDMVAIGLLYTSVYGAGDLRPIYSFRTFGAIMFLPFVALTTLAMSPRLVLWAGLAAAGSWLGAFALVVAGMERTVSWSDLPRSPTRADWEALFFSPDFIGAGSVYTDAIVVVMVTAVLGIAVARARHVFLAQVEAEAQRERERMAREAITRRLGRFVPATVAARLASDPTGLAPQVRHGAALVMDITGFTAFAEGRDPAAVIAELNAFLAACADDVTASGGVVITFMGDGVLATFNTPLEVPRPELAALAAAGALVECGARHGFAIRVGVAAGPIAAGSIGSEERQAFTVYGDTVNRAARLEELAKRLGRPIVADAACARADPSLEPLGAHALDGFRSDVPVWCPRRGAAPLQSIAGSPPWARSSEQAR